MKRLALPVLLLSLALVGGGGCKVVVTPDDGGGGGDTYHDSTYDDNGGGSPPPSNDPPPRHHNPPPRNDPPPRSNSTVRSGPKRTFVGGYRSQYRHLPDLGQTGKYMQATGLSGALDKGYMNGKWKCGVQGMIKNGAGTGQTVIDGDLEIKGDNWVLRGATVTGSVYIRGNNNDISGLEIFGRVEVRGTGNKTP
ncbi:MAG: hypothetical protein AB7N76_02890 [Planctomycetota bacterium]